ncbi:MAG: hypothetical protein AAGJ38_00575 [Planctomycetota bacterium]
MAPFPETRPDPPPGYEQWSPRMTWRSRAVAWLILVLIFIGTVLMAILAFTGPPSS